MADQTQASNDLNLVADANPENGIGDIVLKIGSREVARIKNDGTGTGLFAPGGLPDIITPAGPIGDSTHTPILTVDVKGRVTAIGSAVIAGGSFSGGVVTGATFFKAGPIFDVMAFGAVGDGVTDDTAAIQAAIAAAGNHGVVYFPKHNYLVTDQGSGFCLDISSYNGLTLTSFVYGRANPTSVGVGATIFTTSVGTKILKAEAASLNHHGHNLIGLRFEDRGGNSTCYSIVDYNNYTCRECSFIGFGSGTGGGVAINGIHDASYGRFDNCAFHKNLVGLAGLGSCGFTVQGGYFSSTINNHKLIDARSASVSIVQAKFEGNTGAGVTGGVGVSVPGGGGIEIALNNFEGCAKGVDLVGVGSDTYYGTIVALNNFTGTLGNEIAVSIGAHRVGERVVFNRTANVAADPTPDSGSNTFIIGMRQDLTRAGEFMRMNNVSILSGAGSPAGVVSAPVGSIYLRKDGSTGTSVYVKESGTGTSGWTALGGGGTASWGKTAATYSPSITPNVSDISLLAINATDTVAYTINAPTGPSQGQTVTFKIINNSGGTMGDVTWDAVFRTTWSNASHKPSTTHCTMLQFIYDADAAAWFQVGAPVTSLSL